MSERVRGSQNPEAFAFESYYLMMKSHPKNKFRRGLRSSLLAFPAFSPFFYFHHHDPLIFSKAELHIQLSVAAASAGGCE